MRFLLPLALLTMALAGCSKGEDAALDNAAPQSANSASAPPPVPGKTVHKMPALGGPNAGKGGGIPGE